MTDHALTLSQAIEDMLVRRNPRGMKDLQPALTAGYCERAVQLIQQAAGTVLIATGFPVVGTFETDGPVGAIALYDTLARIGLTPVLVCGKPLSTELAKKYRVHEISVGKPDDLQAHEAKVLAALDKLKPSLIIAIERPGLAKNGHYHNMRGEDISAGTARFDTFIELANCPSIGIGDGGNEIGMGNVFDFLSKLDIIPAATKVSELVIADVSNWAAHGLIALLGWHRKEDLLAHIDMVAILEYLSAGNSVDGVTRKNELTEDGLAPEIGLQLIADLRKVTGFI
ncbi:DUF4392 domain-containing protein [Simiduia curdlanivorans]|uniref:DUF4392 domain-containing protein n=1 Tax=Simiduia curdlanivorans TaxID=1492769 RepID=A0ABV8V133_9GAMM|nr:glutamate cyclase domain-containing protein [Simiduia curdlanivorans]MDN3638105.1 DUF4392 domain-containing protein [Simiduia curdlanivorans]